MSQWIEISATELRPGDQLAGVDGVVLDVRTVRGQLRVKYHPTENNDATFYGTWRTTERVTVMR